MKICPNCQNTDVPDKATKCPYCLYVFEVEEKEPKIVYDPKPIPSRIIQLSSETVSSFV